MVHTSLKGNLVAHFKKSAEQNPKKCAVISTENNFKSKTFEDLFIEVKKTAYYFKNKGIKKGDRILLMVKPGIDLINCCFGLLHRGAIPIIIDPGMGIKSLLKCIKISKPVGIVGVPLVVNFSYLFRETFRTIKLRISVKSNSSMIDASYAGDFKNFEHVNSQECDITAIVFTSGSTGRPKGVRYLIQNFNSQILSLQNNFGLNQNDVDLVTLPIFSLFNPALGVTSVIANIDPRRPASADPKSIVSTIIEHNITSAFCSPIIGKKIASYCANNSIVLPHVKRLMLAGAPTSPLVVEKLSKVIPNGNIFLPYGATEALPVSYSDHNQVKKLKESILTGEGSPLGYPISKQSVILIPIKESPIPNEWEEAIKTIGEENVVGEICVTGTIVTEGYDGMPGASRDARFVYNGNTFHRMGDIGYWDKSKTLRFLGRKAERVCTQYGMLATENCEPIINSFSEVEKCALIGIGDTNPKEPCIVVELSSNFKSNYETIITNIRTLLNEKFSQFKIKRIFIEDKIPVDTRHNAKIHRLSLAKRWTKKVQKKNYLGL